MADHENRTATVTAPARQGVRGRLLGGLLLVATCTAVVATPVGPTAAQTDNIYALSAASNQNQAAEVGTAFSENMQVAVVRLADFTQSVPGVDVTFTAPASGPSGTFATTGTNEVTVTSGPTGLAAAPEFTANDEVGSFSVQVSAELATPNSFGFTNTEEPATGAFTLSVGNGSLQAAQVNTSFQIAMSVSVFDGGGALLPGVDVVFSAPTSGPSGSFPGGPTATVTTGATGLATAPTFTANGEAGEYSVTATVDGSQTTTGNQLIASFGLRNTLDNPHGVPVVVSSTGGGQQTPVLTSFTTAMSVAVFDGSGVHVQGAEVVFTAPDSGASGTFANGERTFTTTTGATGLATASTFTANGIGGSYAITVTATKDGVTAQTGIGLTNGRVGGTTTLEVAPADTSLQGETVTLTATVTSPVDTVVPSGDVEFTDNGTVIGSCAAVAPSAGVATCELDALDPGDHLFRAASAGDATNQPSQSAETSHVVIAASPPAFSADFSPVSILPGGVSRLMFTVDSTANTVAIPDLSFTTDLPAAITVAATPNESTDCIGGTLTAAAGSGTITYSGGTVAAATSCMIAVDVTATTSGQHQTSSGELTSAIGSSGAATATLEVAAVTTSFIVEAATGTGQITGAISGGGPACAVGDAAALDPSAIATAPPDDIDLPDGLIAVTLVGCEPGSAVAVTLTLPTAPSTDAVYWKFGPTPQQPGSNVWYPITPTAISGDQLTFTLVDGGLGDSDLEANGVIVDPGGPAQPAAADPPVTTTTPATTDPSPPGGPTDTVPATTDPGGTSAATTGSPTTSVAGPGGTDPAITTTTMTAVVAEGSTEDPNEGGGNGVLPATGATVITVGGAAAIALIAGAVLMLITRGRLRPSA